MNTKEIKNKMNIREFKKIIPEKMELKMCLSIFNDHGFIVWRNNTGAVSHRYVTKSGFSSNRWVKFGIKGAPDIIGYTPNGKAVFWEVKRYGKKPTKEQSLFLNQAEKNNCFVGWGTSDALLNKLQGVSEQKYSWKAWENKE